MRVAGIDADSRQITAFVIEGGDGTGVSGTGWIRLEAEGRRAQDRFPSLVGKIAERGVAFLANCDYVYIERPFVGPNRKAAIDTGMVIGALRAHLYAHGIPHSEVDPAIWKKAVLGNGGASKEEIAGWARGRFDIADDAPQDTFDAACIAAYGYAARLGTP